MIYSYLNLSAMALDDSLSFRSATRSLQSKEGGSFGGKSWIGGSSGLHLITFPGEKEADSVSDLRWTEYPMSKPGTGKK